MLAKRYGINPKTGAKWKKRTSTADRRTGPSDPHSTMLSVEDEAVIVAFLPHNLLPLDDGLYALQPTIARLTRILAAPLLSAPRHLASARCRGRHACLEVVQALPDFSPGGRCAASLREVYFHVDMAGAQTAKGKLSLLVAIDHSSKFAFAQLDPTAGKMAAAQFLHGLVAAVSYVIRTVLTEFGGS